MKIIGKLDLKLENYIKNEFEICLYLVANGINNLICCERTSDKYTFYVDNIFNEGIYYLEATYQNIKLLNVIGNLNNIRKTYCHDDLYININELTTIASIYCFNKFFSNENKIIGKYRNLNVATLMKENLVNLDGTVSDVLISNPNGNETNSYKMFNTLGNLLYGCISNCIIFDSLIFLTTKNNLSNTIDLFKYIVQNPTKNLNEIYKLATIYEYYKPNLEEIFLSNWLLTIKVNFIGDDNFLFGGPGNFIFDSNDNLWITNNVIQGQTISSNFNVVLQPNGKPTNFSPIFGGGILGSGFGAEINKKNQIFFGSFGWGNVNPEAGAISQFTNTGLPISPSTGYSQDTYRIQGIAVDLHNNLWMCSYGNDRIVVYLNCDPNNSVFLQLPEKSEPFHIGVDSKNNVIASLSETILKGGKLIKMFLDKNNKIIVEWSIKIGVKLLGLSIDKNDNIYVCSSLNNTIYKVNKDASIITSFIKGCYEPWGCCINDKYLYIANFGPNKNNIYGISKYDLDGNLISPIDGYTLLTGGEQVRLHNGKPLYGDLPIISFNPIMRQTAIHTDCAGNVWVTNNWKPNFGIDLKINPGGDGLVVFVGEGVPS